MPETPVSETPEHETPVSHASAILESEVESPYPVRPAAVLWDMDGTLVDTEPDWMAAETELVAEHGGTWTREQAVTLVGSGLADAARVLQAAGVRADVREIIDDLTARVVRRLAGRTPWRPGALELLRALRADGVPTALVTMSMRPMAEAVAAAVPFDGFDLVVSGSDVSRPKPHPEPYLVAARLLGVRIEDCVAIEDSPPGVASAVSAGATVIAVPHVAVVPEGDAWTRWPTLAGRTPADLGRLVAARASRA